MKTFLRMYGMFIYIPILFCSLFSSVIRGQDISTGPVRFQKQTSQFSNNDESQPIWLNNGTLMMIYTSHDSIYCSRSLNSQLTSWDKPSLITSFNRSSQALSIVLSATVTVTNRVILIYSLANKSNLSSEALRITYSDDTGRTWSESKNVYSSMNITFPSIAQSLDGKLWISGRGNYFFISTDNGLTWTPDKRDFTSNCLIALNDNSLISFSESTQNNLTSIQYRKSTDNGKTWSSPVSLSSSQLSEERPRASVSSDGTIWLTYQIKKSTSFNDIYQYDIYYKKSIDKGSSWSQALQLTNYAGSDLDCNISAAQSKAIISFTSDRYFESPFWTYMKLNFKQIWFAIPDSTKDDNSAPAALYASSHSAPSTDGSIPLSFKAYTGSNLGISSVTLSYKTLSQAAERTIELYDDGKHNDNQANDNIWGGSLPEILKAEQLSYSFKITDKNNKVSKFYGGTVAQPAGDLKWMSIGSLQDWYSPMGCEPEETMIHPILKKVDQQTGWQWPADHDLMDCQAWKGLWIGAKNFTDETRSQFPYKVVHVGPRVSGIGEFFPIKFYVKSKYPKSLVTVNGKPSYSPNDAVVDSVDPTMLADRELVNVVSTQLGLTMTRRIFQFSHPYHDNYIVTEYTFTNTGDTDGDPTTIELPNNTLEGVQMFWQYRMAPSFYSRYVIGNSSGWGVNTTIDTRGDGVKPDPAGQNFRTQYAWHGLYTDFATCNNIGGPITSVQTNIAKGDTVWRLAAFQFVGTLTLHADKSAADKTDDLGQPSTTNTFDSDDPLNSGNDAFNLNKMAGEYARMTMGHDKRHLDKIGETNYVMPTKDPKVTYAAGASFGNGYGPYTLKHGESVKIVVAQVAAGMGWEAGEAVGKQYKADRNTLKKNTEVFKGVDSLFTTFKRATDNYNKGWNLQNPPKPPESFSVSGLEKEIMLNWSVSADPDIQGFQIFRASGKRDAKYEMIAEVPANERSYKDTSVSEGENYYYNIRSIGKVIQADSALKLPSTRLTSSRFSTQTYDPASIGTSGINDRKISLADYKLFDNYPNPFNPVTIIKYNVPFESSVRLNVYNMLGEKICELENSLKKAGVYEVEFKASNLPSGIYFYSIEASSKGREIFISAKKMMLLK